MEYFSPAVLWFSFLKYFIWNDGERRNVKCNPILIFKKIPLYFVAKRAISIRKGLLDTLNCPALFPLGTICDSFLISLSNFLLFFWILFDNSISRISNSLLVSSYFNFLTPYIDLVVNNNEISSSFFFSYHLDDEQGNCFKLPFPSCVVFHCSSLFHPTSVCTASTIMCVNLRVFVYIMLIYSCTKKRRRKTNKLWLFCWNYSRLRMKLEKRSFLVLCRNIGINFQFVETILFVWKKWCLLTFI